jgi:hypothetical protein
MPNNKEESQITQPVIASHHQRPKSIEDVNSPQENQDPAPMRDTPDRKDSENPPNENIQKQPDEVYGDTEIPTTHRG